MTLEFTQSSLQQQLSSHDFQPTDMFVTPSKCHHFSQLSKEYVHLLRWSQVKLFNLNCIDCCTE